MKAILANFGAPLHPWQCALLSLGYCELELDKVSVACIEKKIEAKDFQINIGTWKVDFDSKPQKKKKKEKKTLWNIEEKKSFLVGLLRLLKFLYSVSENKEKKKREKMKINGRQTKSTVGVVYTWKYGGPPILNTICAI